MHISARGRPIHFMFGSRVEFSGWTNPMSLIPVWPNSIGMWEKTMRDWSQSKVFLVCEYLANYKRFFLRTSRPVNSEHVYNMRVYTFLLLARGWLKMQDMKMTDHQNCKTWNCRTWNWRTNFRGICKAWNCRTWKWRTNMQGMKLQDMKMTDQMCMA